MYRSDSAAHSGLQQQQPQRYSDRHRQHSSGSGEFPSRYPNAAQQQSGADNSRQAGEGIYDGKRGDQQGIKSYLKKSNVKVARFAKPDTAVETSELELSDIESVPHTKARGQ